MSRGTEYKNLVDCNEEKFVNCVFISRVQESVKIFRDRKSRAVLRTGTGTLAEKAKT